MLDMRKLHVKLELVSALQSWKSWKRLGKQPTITSALRLGTIGGRNPENTEAVISV
jgi:hypothetical protein